MSLKRDIFTVLGVLPEPGGFGIAKFSRSAKPYKEWIFDLTQQGAEKFFKTYYFDYGHESIADLAHITVILENISIVGAVAIHEENLLDAQESSTRYQDYSTRRFYTPQELKNTPLQKEYEKIANLLFDAYLKIHQKIVDFYIKKYARQKPAGMAQDKYERTMKARAYDVARYLLPAGTYTGLGIICSARTLERMVVKLLSSPIDELRAIGQSIKDAATKNPSFNPMTERLKELTKNLGNDLSEKLRQLIYSGALSAPTLIKFANPSEYLIKTYSELEELAFSTLPKGEYDDSIGVELHNPASDEDLINTLLYKSSPHSYRQISALTKNLNKVKKNDFLNTAYKYRGQHDKPIRELATGYEFIYDICMDFGGYRDFHRHRNTVQISKLFTHHLGYDVPQDLIDAKLENQYRQVMDEAGLAAKKIYDRFPRIAQYILPMGYRYRALFKMSGWQVQYITELRSKVHNHFSVRPIAWQMYKEFEKMYPERAKHFRVTPPNKIDFFAR